MSTVSPPAAPGPERGRTRALAWTAGLAATVVVAILVAAAFVRLPYVVTGPGPVTALDDQVLQIDGTQTYDHEGEILFLTVRVSNRRPNAYRVLQAWLDSDLDLTRERDYFGTEPRDDHRALNIRLMEQSQIAAKVVALDVVGDEVTVTPATPPRAAPCVSATSSPPSTARPRLRRRPCRIRCELALRGTWR